MTADAILKRAAIAAKKRDERNAWAERYMFTSTTGRIYHRREILQAAARVAAKWFAPADRPGRAALAAVVDDHAFMIARHGEIPTRVAEAVVEEAGRRWTGRDRTVFCTRCFEDLGDCACRRSNIA